MQRTGARLPHPIRRVVAAWRTAAGVVAYREEVRETRTPPAHATRDADGDWTWVAADLRDEDCPRCAAGGCVQRATICGSDLLVEHDVAARLS